MKNLSEKRSHFKAKTIAVSSVLLTCLATLAVPAQAGSAAWWWNWTGDFAVSDSANWQTIRALNINGGAHAHFCQAVASLDATGPSGDAATQYYFFTLTVNNANPILGGDGVQRTIEMRNQSGVNDMDFMPVSTNMMFTLPANTPYTVRLLGRKSVGAPNIIVDDYHLSILCS